MSRVFRNNYFVFGLLFFVSLVFFLSCKKTVKDPLKQMVIKTRLKDSRPINSQSLKEIISLPDNTFWIHYFLGTTLPFLDRFEHYDEHFNLLDSASFLNYNFGNFTVNGNNDIVVPAFYHFPSQNLGTYRFCRFNNKLGIISVDSSADIYNGLAPFDNYISFTNRLVRLSNGNYIFGFHTSIKQSMDSARIMLAAYKDPIVSGTPLWVNRNRYYDYPKGIHSTVILDMAPDQYNNFYVFARVNGFNSYFLLRKHASDGALLWQTTFYNNPVGVNNVRLKVEADRVLVGTLITSMFSFDTDGNKTEFTTPSQSFKNYLSDEEHGYIALADSFNTGGQYARLLKLDHDFKPKSSSIFGNQGTPYSVIGQLANGKFILAALIETPDLNNYNLMLVKFNDDLELVN